MDTLGFATLFLIIFGTTPVLMWLFKMEDGAKILKETLQGWGTIALIILILIVIGSVVSWLPGGQNPDYRGVDRDTYERWGYIP